MSQFDIRIRSLEGLEAAAGQILQFAGANRVFLVEGPMGSGKTTLIKALSKTIGTVDAMSSPTFSIVNEYQVPGGMIYHFDLYRLRSLEELLDVGMEEYLDSGQYCFIEWPALAEPLVPKPCVRLKLGVVETARYVYGVIEEVSA